MPTNDRRFLGLARLAVLLGAVEFALRALVRTNSNWLSDLAAPYTSARFWLAGENPYNPFTFLAKWQAGGGPNLGLSDFVSGVHSVYPPPTLLLMVPFALLQWRTAVHAFVLLGLVLYFTSVYAMVRLAWPQHRRLVDIATDPLPTFFIAFALAFAPVHTAFHSLNIVLIAACAAMLAVTTYLRSADTADLSKRAISKNSILIGIGVTAAILFKPTTGVFLLPWLARERRWKLIAAVLTACVAITVLAFAPLVAHQGMTWLTNYRQNVTALFTHGGNADVSAENTENTDRIDLQLVAFALLGDRTLASALAAFAYVALLFVFLKQAGWRKTASDLDLSLLVAAGCLALGLLPSYTRVYAAVVLLPLALWCMTHLRLSAARWIMLLLSDFLINSSAIVRKLGEAAGVINRAPRLWDFTIGGHTCWLLLAIGVLLPLAVRQQIEATADSPSAAHAIH